MNYYLLEPDCRIPDICAVGNVPDSVDPLEWMRGKRMASPGPLRLPLSSASGELRADLIGTLLTLFSDNLKVAMTSFGIDNVDYFPVELVSPGANETESGYWLANVIGLIACVDLTRSVIEPRPSGGKGSLRSFYVDPIPVSGRRIFRLAEDPTLIVMDEDLRTFLRTQNLGGVRMRHTKSYDGY